MKKLLILILIALLVLLGYFIIIQGVGAEGSLQILGIKGIQAKNAKKKIEQQLNEEYIKSLIYEHYINIKNGDVKEH